jgi:hypothetical protein
MQADLIGKNKKIRDANWYLFLSSVVKASELQEFPMVFICISV